jgi:hypothetical protein
MNSPRALVLPALVLALLTSALQAQTTNSIRSVPIPSILRTGNFECDQLTIQAAVEVKAAGLIYVMPEPKSSAAAWGNRDLRTTWWIGYRTNKITSATRSAKSKNGATGKVIGDEKEVRQWRRDGSPALPGKVKWLCSEAGGIPPR